MEGGTQESASNFIEEKIWHLICTAIDKYELLFCIGGTCLHCQSVPLLNVIVIVQCHVLSQPGYLCINYYSMLPTCR